MLHIREAIVVEGRYDKNALSQVVDTLILETGGFQIFKDPERMALLERAARRRGLIVLTDSDGAGFVIRNRIKGVIPAQLIKHAYIPDVKGKERRKAVSSKEGTLGVEGMEQEVLLQILTQAGTEEPNRQGRAILAADLYEQGLLGRADSAQRRRRFLFGLDLPAKLSTKSLLGVLNTLYTFEEYQELCQHLT